MKLIFSSISPVKDLADLILLTAGNDKKAKNPDIYIQQLSEKLKGNNVIFTVYAGSDRVSDYVKNLGKLRAKNIDIEVSETIRPIVDLGNQDMPIVTKTGKTTHISGPVELSGTIVRNLINMFPSDHIIMKKIFPPEVFYNNGDFEHIIDMLKQRN